MQLVDMLFDEIEDAKKRRVPFIIPIGTIEYHAHHASCGCDTMVINGTMREIERDCCMPTNLVWCCKLCSRWSGNRYDSGGC